MLVFILFEIAVLFLLYISVHLDFVGFPTARFMFIVIGVINFIIGLWVWRGWPIPRGDISDQSPIHLQDGFKLLTREDITPAKLGLNRSVILLWILAAMSIVLGVVLFQR